MALSNYIFSKDDLCKIIKNANSYYAHLSPDETKRESLIEHILLVQDYFLTLVEKHKLEKIIIALISDICDDNLIQEIITEIFVKSIAIHDFGKVNPLFQINKMKIQNYVTDFDQGFGAEHSIISGYIFTLFSEFIAKKKKVPREKETFVDFLILSFSYPILKHHAKGLNLVKLGILYAEKIDNLKKFADYFCFEDLNFIKEINEYVIGNSNKIFEMGFHDIANPFALFALLKLNYSLLTGADYYATTHFMNDWRKKPKDFGVFTDDLKKRITTNIQITKPFNNKIFKELDNYELEFPEEKNAENLNKLRDNLAIEVIRSIRKNIDKNLFYIEAPTGSGKTNLSMLAFSEILRDEIEKGKNNIAKVFYVFPFTTLITQTFTSLKKTLNLNNDEIVEMHSKAGFSQKSTDDKYGKEKENIIDYQFANYPITLISHIKFFDILKSNRKTVNYLLHRVANSVVIIDELQAYPPKEWDKVIYFINNYAKYFNIKFILMSATLPKIDRLLSDKSSSKFENEEFVCLIEDKDKYFNNPNFSNRVNFDFKMLNNPDFNKENREEYLQKLWNKIKIESKNYKKYNKRVHTIIEFIFKKTASKFMNIANNKNKEDKFFDEIFILSGTILEPRRREIIAK